MSDQSYTVGEAIRPLVLPEAFGGNGTLSYELRPEVPGLTFDPGARTLSGTPTTGDTYEMTYRVTDTDGDADTRSFTVTVSEGDTAPRFDRSVSDQTYSVGEAIHPLVLPEAVGGKGALSYELRPDVPGLTFDPGTRTLSGTPSTVDVYGMTYRVTDTDGDADTRSFTVMVREDTAPSFTRWVETDGVRTYHRATVADRTYALNSDVTCTIGLPRATGGDVDLVYSLTPTVPGWNFGRPSVTAFEDGFSAERTLTVPTTTAGVWNMTYRVEDSDENTSNSDADELRFTITITGEIPPDAGMSSSYQGCEDQVFILNPEGESFDTRYTLRLGGPAHVFVISTNTSPDRSKNPPRIERLDRDASAAAHAKNYARSAWQQRLKYTSDDVRSDHHPPGVVDFNENPPRPTAISPSRYAQAVERSQQPVSVGDRFTFSMSEGTAVPATAYAVTTDGTVTLIVWVADNFDDRAEIYSMASTFLRPGSGNDIYDWLTAIFGEPWGPHNHTGLIPPEAADQIHVLLSDHRPGGYYSSANNYLLGYRGRSYSQERLIFFLTSRSNIFTWAHEFQHMIHFYQKVVKSDFSSGTETWLNEMSSTVAEDLIADRLALDNSLPDGNPPLFDVYKCFTDLQVTRWEYETSREQEVKWYGISYALGAYLVRNYGGAPLFGDIVRNSTSSGISDIEAALRSQGYWESFADVLQNWAIAFLLSDDTQAPHPYRYNMWSTSVAGGLTFRLRPITAFLLKRSGGYGRSLLCTGASDQRYSQINEDVGFFTFSIPEFNAEGRQEPHSNRYVYLGKNTGTVRLLIRASEGTRFTVVVKEFLEKIEA